MSGGAATTTFVAYLEIFSFDPVAIELMLPKRAVARIGRQVLPIAVGAPAFVFLFLFLFFKIGALRAHLLRGARTQPAGYTTRYNRVHYSTKTVAHTAGPSRKGTPVIRAPGVAVRW